MRRRSIHPALVVALALAGVWLLAGATAASAGTYTINACQADRTGFSTQAFDTYANRGMGWKRACNPIGPGQRGLITGNVLRSGRVERGAQSRSVMDAPPGTRFVSLNWSGKARRRDCRYSLQMYAWRPDEPPVKIRNWRANRNCPKVDHAQTAQVGLPKPVRFDIGGATRIVQRVVCSGNSRKRFCSARSRNDLRTYYAEATVLDESPPSVTIVQDNPFTQGAWTNSTQTVGYNATDNLGIKTAQALIGATAGQRHARECDFTRRVPCTNDSGRVTVETDSLGEGTQALQVQSIDAADNANASPAVTVRIDHTAPGAVPLSVEGGDGWRSHNAFAALWQNPDEGDRAPITAASWRLCRKGTDQCATGNQSGAGIGRLADLQVPVAGEYELRMWRADAAGNSESANASQPAALRYDPEPPSLGFETALAEDPTKVAVAVSEKVSDVAGGQIELSQEGSNVWQALPTQLEGHRLVARIADHVLPAGRYLLRAQATDLAGNIGVAAAPQAITLPLRISSALQAGVATTKLVRKPVKTKKKKGRRGARRRTIRRKVTVLRPAARVAFGSHATIAGRLTDRDGQGLAGQQIQVIGPGPNGDQILAGLQTDAQGRYRYRAAGSASRTLRFAFAGTAAVLPAEAQVKLVVAAAGTFARSRKRLANGGPLVFRGQVRGGPVPALGKLVEIQVKQPSGEWTTFRTVRSDAQGRWKLRYRFRLVRCHTTYRLRAHIPAEAGYPFDPGHSRTRSVTVRGAEGPCP